MPITNALPSTKINPSKRYTSITINALASLAQRHPSKTFPTMYKVSTPKCCAVS